jgi:FKBP-type peptidyl-prolyl cis-trans isomerase 2
MALAKAGDTVQVHYTGKLEDGTVFDSSVGGEPIEFVLGEHHVIPGFEDGVTGMEVGETKTILIPSEQAYGPRLEEMVLIIPREQVPPHITLELGEMLELSQPSGETIAVQITALTDTIVTLDGNHPLAGADLTFDLQLAGIA